MKLLVMEMEHENVKICKVFGRYRNCDPRKALCVTLVNQPFFFKSLDFLTLEYVLWLIAVHKNAFIWMEFCVEPQDQKLKEKQFWFKIELEDNSTLIIIR